MKNRKLLKLMIVILFAAAIAAFFVFGGQEMLSLDYMRMNLGRFKDLNAKHPFGFAGAFFLGYIALPVSNHKKNKSNDKPCKNGRTFKKKRMGQRHRLSALLEKKLPSRTE